MAMTKGEKDLYIKQLRAEVEFLKRAAALPDVEDAPMRRSSVGSDFALECVFDEGGEARDFSKDGKVDERTVSHRESCVASSFEAYDEVDESDVSHRESCVASSFEARDDNDDVPDADVIGRETASHFVSTDDLVVSKVPEDCVRGFNDDVPDCMSSDDECDGGDFRDYARNVVFDEGVDARDVAKDFHYVGEDVFDEGGEARDVSDDFHHDYEVDEKIAHRESCVASSFEACDDDAQD